MQQSEEVRKLLDQFRLAGQPPRLPPVDPPAAKGDDGGMEARIAKLEATTEHIQSDIKDLKQDVRDLRATIGSDFRLTWGGIIVATLGLAGLLARGFHWI